MYYVIIGIAIALALIILLTMIRRLLYICPPNKVLIFSGSKRKTATGIVGYKILKGGRKMRTPFIERVDEINLTVFPIEVSVTNAFSKGGIPLTIQGIANIKIGGDEPELGNAIERFLGKKESEIIAIAKETLEGNLRGVLSKLTPEEVNEDRLGFARELAEEAVKDFKMLGLVMDTFKIKNLTDEGDYLNNIGRTKTANMLKEVRMAEAKAKSEAEIVESSATADAKEKSSEAYERGEKRKIKAEIAVSEERNNLRIRNAELEEAAIKKEEKAKVAGEISRAEAEQNLQEVRKITQQKKLEADVIIPAEADKKDKELKAIGAAAKIIEDGKAQATVIEQQGLARAKIIEETGKANAVVIEALRKEWLEFGKDAKDFFLIQKMEAIVTQIVSSINNIRVEKLSVIDSGSGEALPSYVSSFPKSVIEIMEKLKNVTGIDFADFIKRVTEKPTINENLVKEDKNLPEKKN